MTITCIDACVERPELIASQMLAIALASQAARQLPETSLTLRFQVENELFTKTDGHLAKLCGAPYRPITSSRLVSLPDCSNED